MEWDPMSPRTALTFHDVSFFHLPQQSQAKQMKQKIKKRKMKKVSSLPAFCFFLPSLEHLVVTSVFGTGRPCKTFQALQFSAEALAKR